MDGRVDFPYIRLKPDGSAICAATLHDRPFGFDVGFSEPVDAVGRVAVEGEDLLVEIDLADGRGACPFGWVGALDVGGAEAGPA